MFHHFVGAPAERGRERGEGKFTEQILIWVKIKLLTSPDLDRHDDLVLFSVRGDGGDLERERRGAD